MRRALDLITKLVTRLKKNQRHVPATAGPVKVNLGSGTTVAPGWINVDSSLAAGLTGAPRPFQRLAYEASSAKKWRDFDAFRAILRDNVFVQHDLQYGIPLPDASADFLYSAHAIEHLDRDVAQHVMSEAHRVLKPGGVLRINIPNLELAIEAFNRGDTEEALHWFFSKADDGWYSRHRYLYDFKLLSKALEQAGFATVERRTKGEGLVPDLDVFEYRSENGLYAEAIK